MLGSKKTLAGLVLAICGAAAAAVGAGTAENDDRARLVATNNIEALEVAWAADDRFLVGAADDVFVGRVLAAEDTLKTTEGSVPPMPESQFSVEVLRNLKGDLAGRVTINQRGGYQEYPADRDYPGQGVQEGDRVRELSLINGVPLLEPGREYLFVTVYDREDGWHEMVSPRVGKLKIEDGAQREALIRHFERAKEQQKEPRGFGG